MAGCGIPECLPMNIPLRVLKVRWVTTGPVKYFKHFQNTTFLETSNLTTKRGEWRKKKKKAELIAVISTF